MLSEKAQSNIEFILILAGVILIAAIIFLAFIDSTKNVGSNIDEKGDFNFDDVLKKKN